MAGEVGFFEVMGQDTAKLQGFFGELFGWRFEKLPDMDYAMVLADGPIRGGVGAGMGNWSTFYVKVDDVDKSVQSAVRLGGTVLMPAFSLPDGLRVAVIADPEGHAIGLSSR